MEDIIKKHLYSRINKSDIVFINAQGTESSSDYDIYCVVKDPITSSVNIFKEGNVWVEIFIDNWTDMQKKISNYDEICVGLITSLKNYYGKKSLARAKKLIPAIFKIPQRRKNIIYYRIKVLYSKYKSVYTKEEKQYFKNLILQQLFMIAFDYSGVWPVSPKKWFSQIKSLDNLFSKNLITSLSKEDVFQKICREEEDKFNEMCFIKKGKDNQITFIG